MAPPPKKLDLFVGRLDMSTTREALETHLHWLVQGTDTVSVSEIPHCAEKYGYRGFKVTVPAELASRVLTPDKWPSYVSVRKYFQPKGNKNMNAAPAIPKALSRSTSVGNVVSGV